MGVLKPPKIKKAALRTRPLEPRRIERKETDPIYGTVRWREARAMSIALHQYRCAECGDRPRRLFVDHIVELKDGGAAYDQGNLRPLCGACHTTKTLDQRNRRLAVKA